MSGLAGGGATLWNGFFSPLADWSASGMSNKHNDDWRHHIPKLTFKVTNRPSYEAGLRRRGSPTLWVSNATVAA